MHLDLRTVAINPLRNTFAHVARHIGGDKPATRYQEATYDIQATKNFHYRPTWAPDYEIFDSSRTAIQMDNWNKLLDPRQYYYGSYTLARARMQEGAEAAFSLVEERGLADDLTEDLKTSIGSLYVPLRHREWGANTNCMYMCAYGYGAAFTNPAIFHAMDHLGIAQYLTRVGLALGDSTTLDAAKAAWMVDPDWQGLRKYVEDCFVLTDWFELFVADAVVLDGLLYPLFYGMIDERLSAKGGRATLAMLTRFQSEWFTETKRWLDAVIKTAAENSPANKVQLKTWIDAWTPRAIAALAPLAKRVFGEEAESVMEELHIQFSTRLGKLVVALGPEG